MLLTRLISGRFVFTCGIVAAALWLLASDPAWTADLFPFDQELILDAAPMRPARRVPSLTVMPDGSASVDLWCRTVRARVELSDVAIKIEPGPLPDGLPAMMSEGQCTPPRMQADQDMLAALAQVTGWGKQGDVIILAGPKMLKFRPATN